MRKRLYSKTAVSLIELIIATFLIIVVILGISAVNTVLSGNNQDYGQRYLVRSATQSTLNHILNNATLAVGSANSNDAAILIGGANGLADQNTFCIHQPHYQTNGDGSNLINSPTDIWLCYSWSGPNGTGPNLTQPYSIYWCAETYDPYPPTADPRGATSCNSAGLLSGPNFLGTAYFYPTNSYYLSSAVSFSNDVFSITLNNCLNNADSTNCNSTGVSGDSADNPEVQVTGSVTPLQASM